MNSPIVKPAAVVEFEASEAVAVVLPDSAVEFAAVVSTYICRIKLTKCIYSLFHIKGIFGVTIIFYF